MTFWTALLMKTEKPINPLDITYVRQFSVENTWVPSETQPSWVTVNELWTKLIVLWVINAKAYQYTLPTPSTLISPTYDSVTVAIFIDSINRLNYSQIRGNYYYHVDFSNLHWHALPTAWDLTSAWPRVTKSFWTGTWPFWINKEWTKLFMIASIWDNPSIRYYEFSTPFDVSSIWATVTAFGLTSNRIYWISLSNNLKNLFILSRGWWTGLNTTAKIKRYDMSIPWDITTLVDSWLEYDYWALTNETVSWFDMNEITKKMYVSSDSNKIVREFDI